MLMNFPKKFTFEIELSEILSLKYCPKRPKSTKLTILRNFLSKIAMINLILNCKSGRSVLGLPYAIQIFLAPERFYCVIGFYCGFIKKRHFMGFFCHIWAYLSIFGPV